MSHALPPIERLQNIMAALRAPNGCPWDREQTHASIKPQLLEETYEVLEAIDSRDMKHLQEELGDVLLHIVFHSQLAKEEGTFTFDDVATGVSEKLVRRHPHVFGDVKAETSADVLVNWDAIKKQEKPERTGALDGVPAALPALMRAQEIQKKAAKVGFDWPNVNGAMEKVREEIAEVESAPAEHRAEELGDLMFALVNVARHWKLDAEDCLRGTSAKFEARFRWIEARLLEQGRTPQQCTLQELDALWDEAKADLSFKG
jgi:MazG family protein